MEATTAIIHRDIIEQSRKGDDRARMQLYRLYYRAMYNVALRIVTDRQQAEELMQDGFLEAFRKLDCFEGRSSFGAWLKRIVINKCLDAVKRREPVWVELENLPELPQEADEEEIRYDVGQVKEALRQLAPGYRIILTLYLLEGYDHEEIAGIMGISPATSRSQYTRAKARLKQQLKQPEHV